MPEGPGGIGSAVAEAVERLDRARLSGTRRDPRNRVHRPGLDLESAPRVGHDGVLRRALRDQNWLRHLLEEIHDGRAPEPKGPGVDPELQDLTSLRSLERGDDEVHFGSRAGT